MKWITKRHLLVLSVTTMDRVGLRLAHCQLRANWRSIDILQIISDRGRMWTPLYLSPRALCWTWQNSSGSDPVLKIMTDFQSGNVACAEETDPPALFPQHVSIKSSRKYSSVSDHAVYSWQRGSTSNTPPVAVLLSVGHKRVVIAESPIRKHCSLKRNARHVVLKYDLDGGYGRTAAVTRDRLYSLQRQPW